MRSRRPLEIGLPAIAVAALLLAGCGSSPKPPPPGSPSAAENLVTAGDLAATPADSPARAVMTTWRSVQYADLPGYLESLSRPLRLELEAGKAARRYLPLAAGQLTRAKPEISDTVIHGDSATVYARIDFRIPLGSTRYQSSSTPQAFSTSREDGKWKLADDLYFRSQAKLVAEARVAEAAAKK